MCLNKLCEVLLMLNTISLKYQNTTVVFLLYKYDTEKSLQNNFEFHKHLNYEIHFALSGHYKYEFANKNIVLNQNQMLIIPPGTPHKVVESKDKKYEFAVLTLKFSTDDADKFYDYFHSIFDENAMKCLNIQEGLIKSVSKLNDAMTIDQNNCLHNIYLTSCASELLYKLSFLMTENKNNNTKWLLSKNEKHLDVQIENLVNANMSLNNIANTINYSTRQTERLIKKIYGKSLSELQKDLD